MIEFSVELQAAEEVERLPVLSVAQCYGDAHVRESRDVASSVRTQPARARVAERPERAQEDEQGFRRIGAYC